MSYTFQDYVKDALRTESVVHVFVDPGKEIEECDSWGKDSEAGKLARLLHAALGLSTEAGELLDVLKKNIFYGKTIDYVNVKEELGDLLWYVAIALDALDLDPSEVMITNINKLRTRYPEKFTSSKAIERDLESERKVLESTVEQDQLAAANDRIREAYAILCQLENVYRRQSTESVGSFGVSQEVHSLLKRAMDTLNGKEKQ